MLKPSISPGSFFVLSVKTLFLFTSGVFLLADVFIRIQIFNTQAWATDNLWLWETALIFGLSLICFGWCVRCARTLADLAFKLFVKEGKNIEEKPS
jgi:hypothetical protein